MLTRPEGDRTPQPKATLEIFDFVPDVWVALKVLHGEDNIAVFINQPAVAVADMARSNLSLCLMDYVHDSNPKTPSILKVRRRRILKTSLSPGSASVTDRLPEPGCPGSKGPVMALQTAAFDMFFGGYDPESQIAARANNLKEIEEEVYRCYWDEGILRFPGPETVSALNEKRSADAGATIKYPSTAPASCSDYQKYFKNWWKVLSQVKLLEITRRPKALLEKPTIWRGRKLRPLLRSS